MMRAAWSSTARQFHRYANLVSASGSGSAPSFTLSAHATLVSFQALDKAGLEKTTGLCL